jgi:hypothetical protein
VRIENGIVIIANEKKDDEDDERPTMRVLCTGRMGRLAMQLLMKREIDGNLVRAKKLYRRRRPTIGMFGVFARF